jgi:hypothetical protein
MWRTSVTIGEMSWLLFGAVLGATAAYAIAVGITVVARLIRLCNSTAAAPNTLASERGSDAPKPRITD